MTVPPLSIHAWLRYDVIRRLLSDANGVRSVLEIGAGQGSVGVMLARRYAYTGIERDATSFAAAARRFDAAGVEGIVNGDLSSLPPQATFDLVCAFEVLEHCEDDAAALEEWSAFIRPGGWLSVSVPAGPDRFGPTDEKAGHYRRYAREGLERLLGAVGFREAKILAYGFPAGYALEAGRNLVVSRQQHEESLERRTDASGRWLQPPEWSARLMKPLALPFALILRPFAPTSLGTGLVALARRP